MGAPGEETEVFGASAGPDDMNEAELTQRRCLLARPDAGAM